MKLHPLLTVFFLILTAASLLFGVTSYLAKEREAEHRMYVEESLLRATRAKQMMEKELGTYKEKAAVLEHQVIALQRTNRFTVVRLRGLERKFMGLRKDFAKIQTVKESLESEVTWLKGRVQEAGVEKGEASVRSAQEVDLGQIVVSATPSLEGKVLAVNQPYQFVVVDLGDRQNLTVGTVLSIYREKDFIGRIQVEEVRETIAACRILPEWTRKDIQEDDFVKEL